MSFAAELKKLLRPMGLYELNEGVGAAELTALGAELDAIADSLSQAEKNVSPLTADDAALTAWEALMPYIPKSDSSRERREALCALRMTDGLSFSADALNRTLSGCGITARVREGDEPFHVTVSFPNRRGLPTGFEDMPELSRRIEAILPCHLAVDYDISFFNWGQLERLYPSWEELESAVASWAALELVSE